MALGQELVEALDIINEKTGKWFGDSEFTTPSTIIDAELGVKITIQGFIQQGIAPTESYKWKPAASTDTDRIIWGEFRWR